MSSSLEALTDEDFTRLTAAQKTAMVRLLEAEEVVWTEGERALHREIQEKAAAAEKQRERRDEVLKEKRWEDFKADANCCTALIESRDDLDGLLP